MITENRNLDYDMLKVVLQHCSKLIYDATLSHSGSEIARNDHYDGDTSELIAYMERAMELMKAMYEENCSITELGKEESNHG